MDNTPKRPTSGIKLQRDNRYCIITSRYTFIQGTLAEIIHIVLHTIHISHTHNGPSHIFTWEAQMRMGILRCIRLGQA